LRPTRPISVLVDDPLETTTTTITLPPTSQASSKNLPVRLWIVPNAAAKEANASLKDAVDLRYTYGSAIEQTAVENFDVSNDRPTTKTCSSSSSSNNNNNNQDCVIETTLYVAFHGNNAVAKGRTVFQPGEETEFQQIIVDFELPIQISSGCFGECQPVD